MTPLIQHMARTIPYPGDDAHWFELGGIDGGVHSFDWSDDRIAHLPYPLTIICAQDARGDRCAISIRAGDSGTVTLAGLFLMHDGTHKAVGPFGYAPSPDGLKLFAVDSTPREAVNFCLALIHKLVTALDAGEMTAHVGTPDRGYTSTKRMKAGKAPLRYTWRTVIVRPATRKVAVATPHVATHASPRAHDRRGHWRTYKSSGKRVWIKTCRVGDAALGAVFKDYKVCPSH